MSKYLKIIWKKLKILEAKILFFNETTIQSIIAWLALEFYKKNKFDRLEWPPYSPDLNPIENIWGIVKQEVNKYDLLKYRM